MLSVPPLLGARGSVSALSAARVARAGVSRLPVREFRRGGFTLTAGASATGSGAAALRRPRRRAGVGSALSAGGVCAAGSGDAARRPRRRAGGASSETGASVSSGVKDGFGGRVFGLACAAPPGRFGGVRGCLFASDRWRVRGGRRRAGVRQVFRGGLGCRGTSCPGHDLVVSPCVKMARPCLIDWDAGTIILDSGPVSKNSHSIRQDSMHSRRT